MLNLEQLTALANDVSSPALTKRDKTPPQLVGVEVALHGKRFRVLSANTSNAKWWGRVIDWANAKPQLRTHSGGKVRWTRSEAARSLHVTHGFLCALKPLREV